MKTKPTYEELEKKIKDLESKLEQYKNENNSEYKKKEKTLIESEERYHNFITNSAEGIFRVDFDPPIPINISDEKLATEISEHAVVGEVNDALSRIYGLNPNEMIGQPVSDFTPEYGEKALLAVRSPLHQVRNFEISKINKDGQVIYLSVSYSAVIKKGVLLRIWGMQHNITDQKKTENALRENEARFRAAFESTQDCILIWDKEYNYLYANQAAIDHVGTTPDKVIGKNIRDGLGHIPDFMKLWMRRVDKVFNTGEILKVTDESEMLGNKIYTHSILSPIKNSNNNTVAVCVVYRNITDIKKVELELKKKTDALTAQNEEYESLNEELKQTIAELSKAKEIVEENEVKFRTFMEQSPFGVQVYDVEGTLLHVNKAWADMWNVTDTREVIGKYNPLKDPQIKKMGLENDMKRSFKGDIVILPVIEYDPKDSNVPGRKRTIQASTYPILDTKGEIKNVIIINEDITDKKAAEKELFRTNANLKAMIENTDDYIMIADKEGVPIMYNTNYKNIIENALEIELKPGIKPHTLIEDKKMDELWNNLHNRVLSGEQFKHDFEYVVKGTKLYFEFSFHPVYEGNSIVGFVEYSRDISENKRTEKIHKVLYNISKHANESIELISFLNKVHQELSALINVDNFYVALHHGGCTYSFPYHLDEYDEFTEPEELFELEFSLTDYVRRTAESILIDKKVDYELRKKGEIKLIGEASPIWLGAPLFNNKGKSIGIVSVQDYNSDDAYSIRDLELLDFVARNVGTHIEKINALNALEKNLINLKITKDKVEESKNRLKALSKATTEAIFFSEKGYCIETNEAASTMFGYSYDEIIGIFGTDVIAPESQELVKQNMLSGYEKPYDAIALRKDGTKFHAEFQGRMFKYQSKLIRVTAVRDISIRKMTENKLLKAKEKAEESDKLKTEFINNMSHEIRTPMNGIMGFSEFLKEHGLSDKKRSYFVNIIQNCGNQLLQIIDDILEISQLGTKQVKAIEKELCLNDLFLGLFSIFDIKAKENKTPLYLKKGLPDKESTILTDVTKLNKILSNLIDNALKYTSVGYIEFGYKVVKDKIEIYVKDTGIGIRPEKQEIIFERFSQEEDEISKKAGGLGLGLSIAKENAQLIGGDITLKSEKGVGTTFYIKIPYKPVSVENLTVVENDSVLRVEGESKKYTFLIAEDEEVNYLYLETLLQNMLDLNCNIIHSKDGQEAVEICKKNLNIDIVFMDFKMPKLDGYEATKQIKEFRPELIIIAQTVCSTNEEKEKAILVGCDDFISKPIKENILKKALDKHLTKD